jgi:two-component system sensor histidine kinase YesM
MKKKIHINSLFVKILCTVIIGIVCLSASLSMLNLFISKDVFAENFSASQQKAFKQIDNDFYEFFSLITDVATRASTSWAVHEYLTAENQEPEEEMKTIYYMQDHMNETRLDEHSELNVMLVGFNGKSHFLNSARREISLDEILKGKAAKKAIENPDKLICEYEESGYTDNQKNSPVLVMAKVLSYGETNQYDGIIFISIKESEFENIYEYFTSDTNDIIILNQDEEVVSSNEHGYLTGEKQEKLEFI